MTSHPRRSKRSRWRIDPAAASAVHLPTGLRVQFVQDDREPGAWDGKPVPPTPQPLLDRARLDGGKELAKMMREAGEAYYAYLQTR